MSLPSLSINRPVFAWMLMCALILFGAIAFNRLGVGLLPDVDFPVVGISISWNGAAPEVMEQQIVDPIEDSLMTIDGIRNINSSSQQGSASISVEFDLNRNIDEAVQEVQNRINSVQQLLPTNMDPPVVRKSNPEDMPIMWIALGADDTVSRMEMMMFAHNELLDHFSTIPGVGNIFLGGYVDPALRVWVDHEKLKSEELNGVDVLNTIIAEHVELPAGRLENASHEYNVRLMGEAKNPTEFSQMHINKRTSGVNYQATPLYKVAKVEEDLLDVRSISRFNGKQAVGLGILKQHGSNTVEVADLVRKKLEEIKPLLPKAYQMSIRSDSTLFIKQSTSELNFNLLMSALLTAIVCYLFLGHWSSTFNVLMSIPTSIVGTFIAIYFFGFTLNTFTLLALSLAIGIVVDDAIMMLENIVRHRQLGAKKKVAALRGAEEITFAALAATLAVVAIFLPVVFMRGVIGRFFLQYGVTVTIAVLLSLLEALTLTPMRCSRFLSVGEDKGLPALMGKLFANLEKFYQRILSVLLQHRWKTVAATLIFFALSMGTAFFLPKEMIPAQDQSMFIMRIKGEVGQSIDFTNAQSKKIENYLMQQKDTVDGYYAAVGGFGGGGAVNQIMIFVTLLDKSKRKLSQAEIIKKFKDEISPLVPEAKVVLQDLSMRGFGASRGFPVEFTIQGQDWKKLVEMKDKMMQLMTESGVMTDVNSDIQPNVPEVHVIPDRAKAAAHGVAIGDISNLISILFGGAILNGQTKYTKDGHRYPIEIRLPAQQRNLAKQLEDIHVKNNRGTLVPLKELVQIETAPSLQLISRLNRSRAITIYANVAPKHAQQEAMNVVEKLSKSALEPGYIMQTSGSAQSFKESFQDLIYALILGIVVSYMVLASQFNSFIHPLSVLMALPFSFSGAFIGLAITHQSLNIYSMIGLILLMGIVKKNSILLVDFTNQLRRTKNLGVVPALLEACPVRLRPIMMTSVATIVAALPEALAFGPGAETIIPMATAIIGGVMVSTLLTLFVVPCVYGLLARFEHVPTAEEKEAKKGAY